MQPFKADMSALNESSAEDAIAAEAEVVRQRGEKLDAYTKVLKEHADAVNRQTDELSRKMAAIERRIDSLAGETRDLQDQAATVALNSSKALSATRSEIVGIYDHAGEKAAQAASQAAGDVLSGVEETIRNHNAAVTRNTDGAMQCVADTTRKAAEDFELMAAEAKESFRESRIDTEKYLKRMEWSYRLKTYTVPAILAAAVIILSAFVWRAWPFLTGRTMTDLDAANLTISKQQAEIDAYKGAGVTLTEEQQAALDDQMRALQDEYDQAHGPAPASVDGQ